MICPIGKNVTPLGCGQRFRPDQNPSVGLGGQARPSAGMVSSCSVDALGQRIGWFFGGQAASPCPVRRRMLATPVTIASVATRRICGGELGKKTLRTCAVKAAGGCRQVLVLMRPMPRCGSDTLKVVCRQGAGSRQAKSETSADCGLLEQPNPPSPGCMAFNRQRSKGSWL